MSLSRRLGRIWDDDEGWGPLTTFGEPFMHWRDVWRPFSRDTSHGWRMMPVDVREDEKHFEMAVDIPGFTKEEIKIETDDNNINISAERSKVTKEERAKYHMMERCHGRVWRSMNVPKNVDKDRITANYEGGVLRIVLPKLDPQGGETRRTVDID